ncbi:putative ammonium transporter sll0108 [Mercenaria mercenaria]|uniref:putative ammonium transporter sll0108 n=1 Tax=Mercenaria mercenaria TaxID=6596 RepID=UPI00234E3ED0|nr:putative ammonium transporter sll0108 [Mercenaria mercenaria]XP_045176372.2 putative ammonium transporter sll0108 [Mercenaria mercenaria]
MTSLFGLPRDILGNLTDSRELVADGERMVEKLKVVGGKDLGEETGRVLDIFGQTVSDSSHDAVLFTMVTQLYTIVPVILIVFCQIGFAMLQSGASRVESAAVPFITNILVLVTSCLSFWAVGYALARSDGLTMLGYHQWFSHEFEPKLSIDWLLHFSLVLTTANIATSGGLERCPIYVNCLLSPIIAGVVAALSDRWAWHRDSWTMVYSPFQGVAYKDQGGSGVIHMVGGSSALVLSLLLGPRYSRIRDSRSRILFNDLDGHSLPLELIGWYFCVVCFFCCNCVRLTTTCITCHSISNTVARAVVNSVISAASASLSTVVFVYLMKTLMGRKRFHYLISRQLANGAVIGIISVAAGCDSYPHWAAFVVGLTSAVGYVVWCQVLYFLRIDDPIGVISVHLGGGLWGVICVTLFREKTGLVFADQTSVAGLAIVWNVTIAVTMATLSAVLTGAVLLIPRILDMVPIQHGKELQGVDVAFLGQQAYPSGNTVSPFTTDIIEDREEFIDSNPASPQTTVTSPLSYTFSGFRPDNLPAIYDMKNPYEKLEIDLKSLPSFTRSPGDTDRRVWFSGESLRDQVAPMTPIIDYSIDSDRWEDIEF